MVSSQEVNAFKLILSKYLGFLPSFSWSMPQNSFVLQGQGSFFYLYWSDNSFYRDVWFFYCRIMALLCICFLSLGYVVFRLCQINLPFEAYLFELPYSPAILFSVVACISLFCIKMCFAPQSIKVGERSRIGSFSLPFVWGRNFFSCNNTQLAQWFLSMCVRLSRSVLFRFLCWVTVFFLFICSRKFYLILWNLPARFGTLKMLVFFPHCIGKVYLPFAPCPPTLTFHRIF